ncbi:MAG: cell wall hydrolase [Oscillospiraceae bacterium]|nr:cell wall hydrolase [Oscillospiraceae bacterium]
MKRAILIIAVLALVLSAPALAREEGAEIMLDGVTWEQGALLLEGRAYVPLRALCEAVGVAVTWDAAERTARMTAPGLEASARPGDRYLSCNGHLIYEPGAVVMRSCRVWVSARALAQALGLGVIYVEEARRLVIETGGALPVWEDYDRDDLYWLSHIIEAEAGAEPFAGKIAVGNVVLTRMDSDKYPDTVRDVVFDKRHGIQFSPAWSGRIYEEPSRDSVLAARLCLDGAVEVVGCFYFTPDWKEETSWAGQNRPKYGTIGSHVFFT